MREFHHLGLKISENTLQGWFKPACELLKPLYEELKKQVLKADYIQVDETTLPVINKQNHKAVKEYLWIVRAVMDGLVFFHYDDGSAHRKQPGNYYKPSKDIFKVTAMRPTTSLRVRKRCALSDALPT